MVLIEAIRSLKRSGLSVKNETVIDQVNYLLGSDLIGSGNNVQSAKLWLEKAGVLSGWNINESKVQKIIGLTEAEMQLIQMLTPEQYYFLRTLCNVNSNKYLKGAEVRELAETTYHVSISPKTIAPAVILPLEKEKLISAKKPTSGRGGASYLVKATADSKKKLIEPLLNQIEILLGKDLLDYYQKPLNQIRKDMSSRNTYVKGLALEAFAIRLMKYIGLDFHSTRLRGAETAGAEIDAIFESSHLVFSRWQVQCKNIKKTSSVSLDQVAKEVGLSHVLLSNAIVIMTTGRVSESARRYANDVMRTMNICIIMIDGDDLDEIVASPTNIIDISNYDMAKVVYGDEHEDEIIKMPANLTLLATMNTSDQNVFTLDTAFQRRWEMHLIKNDVYKADHADEKIGGSEISWGRFADVTNMEIIRFGEETGSSEDKRLGAYFAKLSELSKDKFPEKVLKYLWDDAFKMDHYTYFNESISSVDGIIDVFRESQSEVDVLKRVLKLTVYQKMLGQAVAPGNTEEVAEAEEGTDDE